MKGYWGAFIFSIFIAFTFINGCRVIQNENRLKERRFNDFIKTEVMDTVWRGAPASQIPYYSDSSGKLIYYGYQLIANTAYYLGPKGRLGKTSNALNCQNCHLDGGTRPFGNNFGKVMSTYPQYKARNNETQDVYLRINDCMLRSMNGKPLNYQSREIKAIYAYIKWLDKGIPKGVIRGGTKMKKLPYLNRAANPESGKQVFIQNCQSCHGADGQGQYNSALQKFDYPPLWGPNSYNDGAGMFRLGTFASFVKYNMPYGTNYHNTVLKDADAWDVAAYVNSQPRPHMDQHLDWKNIAKKPVDFPFPPFSDTFSVQQHKYGPFLPILKMTKKQRFSHNN